MPKTITGFVYVLAGLALFVAGCGGTHQSAALPSQASIAKRVRPDFVVEAPSAGAYLGAWVNPASIPHPVPSEVIYETAQFESQIGRKLALHLHYRNWS